MFIFALHTLILNIQHILVILIYLTLYHQISLPSNYIPDRILPRKNHDTRPPDSRGKEILESCKSTGMRIVNRRKIRDTNGRFTCYTNDALIPSMIDYALVDDDLLSEITYFRVDDLTTHSDHCTIYLRMSTGFSTLDTADFNNFKLQPPPLKFI